MNRKKRTYIYLFLLTVFILVASFIRVVKNDSGKKEIVNNVNEVVVVNNSELNVIYLNDYDLDVHLTYGNINTQILKIVNNNSVDLPYSIKYIDSVLSNSDVIYDMYISYDEKEYLQVIKDNNLIADSCLKYSLVIPKNSTTLIKIIFKSLHQNDESVIKGHIKVTDNLTSLELFKLSINSLNSALEDKVYKLNGISKKGYYYLDINELSFINDALIKGYIIIDANDISDIKYIYTVYNDKYMINNAEYKNMNISNADVNYINSLNVNKICNQYDTRITCSNFMNVPKSKVNEKKLFYDSSIKVINTIINSFDKDGKVHIYDISKDIDNETKLVGYILKDDDNMFVYIHNDLFMISGYNYTKLGTYDINSKTIVSYNEVAFNHSASDKQRVCSFSGYEECYDINNERIGSV